MSRPLASPSGLLRWALRTAALLVLASRPLAAQAPAPPQITETALELSDGSVLRYAISLPGVPDSAAQGRPLVLVLHPGGRAEYYGSSFMQSIVEPGLRSWGAVMVAPDVPDRSWSTVRSEMAVLALIEHVLAQHAIDRDRIVVTGYSMGGGGTWYMAARHADVFDGAIVMAGSPRGTEVTSVTVPIYLIHSPDDEVVPFAGAEAAYEALSARGQRVELRVLPGRTHYQMAAYVPALRVAGDWMLERWSAR
jgi:predicted peptidase